MTVFQQGMLSENVNLISIHIREWQSRSPDTLHSNRKELRLLDMLQRRAASQQGIITQRQRWMTPGMHF